MPNYGLVINSKFRPFSYQEMLAPVQQSTEAHKDLEDKFDEIAVQAGTLEALLNPAIDKDATEQYRGFIEGLNKEAEALAKEGLTPLSRTSLSNMRKSYISQIVPLQDAANRRLEEIKLQRQSGDTKEWEYDASTRSLDDYVRDKTLTSKSINKEDVLKKSMTAYSTLAKRLRDYSLTKDPKIKDQYKQAFYKEYGRTPEEYSNFLNQVRTGMANGVPLEDMLVQDATMYSMFKNLYDQTGVGTWNNSQAQRNIADLILTGAAQAIGPDDISLQTDEGAVLREKARIAASVKKDNTKLPTKNYTPRNFFGVKDVNKAVSDWNKYKDYFAQDAQGNWYLKAGAPSRATSMTYQGTVGSSTVGGYTAFGKFLKDYGLENIPTEQEYRDINKATLTRFGPQYGSYTNLPKNAGSNNRAVNEGMAMATGAYDATLNTEYTQSIDHVNFPEVQAIVSKMANEGNVLGASYVGNPETGIPEFRRKSTKKDISDLTYNDIVSAATVISPFNETYLEVKYKDGETVNIPISDYDPEAAQMVLSQVRGAQAYAKEGLLPESEQIYNAAFNTATGTLTTTKVKERELDANENYTEALIASILD